MTRRTIAVLLFAWLWAVDPLFAEKPAREVADTVEPTEYGSDRLDLSGEWKLLLPAGFERTVKLEPAPDGRWFLSPYALGGAYEVRGDRLVCLSSERLAPGTKVELSATYEWEIRSPYFLTLVRQPKDPAGRYLGAVLFREKDGDGEKEKPVASAEEVQRK